MRLVLTVLLLLVVPCWATTYYAPDGGVAGWNTAVWATSDHQATGSSGPPTASDAVVLGSSAGAVVIASASAVAASVDASAYTNTLSCSTSGQKLTVSGSFNMGASGTIQVSNACNLTLGATGTLTLNNSTHAWPGSLTFAGTSQIYTLAVDSHVTGLTTLSGTTAITVNYTDGSHGTLYADGGITVTTNTSGTALIVVGGGTITGTGTLTSNLTVNSAGTVTFSSLKVGTMTLTWTAGTISGTGTLTVGGTVTWDTANTTWPTVTFGSGSGNNVLNSDFNASVCFTNGGYAQTWTGAHDITCGYLVNNAGMTWAAGRTLTVSTGFYFPAAWTVGGPPTLVATAPFKSGTASSTVYLHYNGTFANCQVQGATFTDVDATGGTTPIINYDGGTLTRTAGIFNITGANMRRNWSVN